MNYEKAYKEALERAKRCHKDLNNLDGAVATMSKDFFEEVFPELKESEDERIRKELIKYLSYCDDISKDIKERWLAWLEKQGEKDNQVIFPTFTFDDILALQCCMQAMSKNDELYKKLQSLHDRLHEVYGLEKQGEQLKIKQGMLTSFRNSVPEEWDFSKDKDLKEEVDRCFHNGMLPKYITPNTTITVSDLMRCASHFYKFGKEQKPVDKVETIYKIGDFVHCTTINGFEYTYIYKSNHGEVIHAFVNYSHGTNGVVSIDYTLFEPSIFTKRKATKEEIDTLLQSLHKHGIIWDAEKKELKKIEQRSIDNLEPKFRNGQWIVWQDRCYKVNYNGCGYELVDQNGLSTSSDYEDVDKNAHIWDVTKDAKDGDVLAVDGRPFIYNGSKNTVTVGAYCGFNEEHRFSCAYNYAINRNITPTTKEQSDLLFQKISETGYEWDSKTKQLIKL